MDHLPGAVSPDVEALIVARYRQMTPNERFQKMLDLNAFVKETQTTAVRSTYPDADDFEVRMRVASRWVKNPELLRAAFGWDVDEKGY
jgi:hypothetical protein